MVSVDYIIAVLGCCLSVATFLIGRQGAAKTTGREMGELNKTVNFTKESMERVEKKVDLIGTKLELKVDSLEIKVTEALASARSAHHRIDEIVAKQ